MPLTDLVPGNPEPDKPASPEIEFALVLSRLIESVETNPEDLRQAIYELARHKLKEQFDSVEPNDAQRSEVALETAIRGVEDFSQRHGRSALGLSLSPPMRDDHRGSTPQLNRHAPFEQPDIRDALLAINPDPNNFKAHAWRTIGRTLAVVGVASIIVVLYLQREQIQPRIANLFSGKRAPETTVATNAPPPAMPIQQPQFVAPVTVESKPTRLLPTAYGVYSVQDRALIELKQLPGRPPDMRVAISAAITEPPKTIVANGRPTFIVFRRDLAANPSDKADVRIMARVTRQFSAAGEMDKNDRSWVIRNLSFVFRASPIAENPDMYELTPEDPATDLPAGRYALSLKSVAFDFVVPGESSDLRHCLERVVSTTGTFYSECAKLHRSP